MRHEGTRKLGQKLLESAGTTLKLGASVFARKRDLRRKGGPNQLVSKASEECLPAGIYGKKNILESRVGQQEGFRMSFE